MSALGLCGKPHVDLNESASAVVDRRPSYCKVKRAADFSEAMFIERTLARALDANSTSKTPLSNRW
jgi:hypothetical protein